MPTQMLARNRWRSFPATDPLMLWTLTTPFSSRQEARRFAEEVLLLGRESGVLIAGANAIAAEGEPLPWEQSARAGGALPFTTRVSVRDGSGKIVDQLAADAGKLLATLERLDPSDVPRIAASRPFVAAWTTSTLSTMTVNFAFFTTLWIDIGDPELHERNTRRLEALRTGLTALAKRHAGRLTAMMPAPAR